MQSWMFLSSYENMRANILDKYTIETMVHMGNGVMKIAFGTNATVFRNVHIPSYQGAFSYTENDDINDEGYPKEFPVKNDRLKTAAADDFQKSPVHRLRIGSAKVRLIYLIIKKYLKLPQHALEWQQRIMSVFTFLA